MGMDFKSVPGPRHLYFYSDPKYQGRRTVSRAGIAGVDTG